MYSELLADETIHWCFTFMSPGVHLSTAEKNCDLGNGNFHFLWKITFEYSNHYTNRRRAANFSKSYMLLNRGWIQCQQFFETGLCFVVMALSPALDARDWIQHRAASYDANSHHVERVVVAVRDVIQPACTSISSNTVITYRLLSTVLSAQVSRNPVMLQHRYPQISPTAVRGPTDRVLRPDS